MQRLIEGAEALGLRLTDKQQAAFELYYEELVAWNQRFNLTAITDPAAMVSGLPENVPPDMMPFGSPSAIALNKRMMNMVVERIKDQVQVFELLPMV